MRSFGLLFFEIFVQNIYGNNFEYKSRFSLNSMSASVQIFAPFDFLVSFMIHNVRDIIGCRFDAREFLLKFKGKSVMFVGDSLSRNQWQSLICMLYASVGRTKYNETRVGDVSIFTFMVIAWFTWHIQLQHFAFLKNSKFFNYILKFSNWIG